MMRTEMGGDRARISAFIEGGLGEADREGVEALIRPRRRQRREHQARIEAARQKHAERHIAHQPALGGLAQQRRELVDQARLGVEAKAVVRFDPEAPVRLDGQGGISEIKTQPMSARQFAGALQQRVRRRYVAVSEELLQRALVQ